MAAAHPTYLGGGNMLPYTGWAPLWRDLVLTPNGPHELSPRVVLLENFGPNILQAIPHRGGSLAIFLRQGASALTSARMRWGTPPPHTHLVLHPHHPNLQEEGGRWAN